MTMAQHQRSNQLLRATYSGAASIAPSLEYLAGATGLEPAASCVTGRHLSRAVNNLLIWAHEFSSESPQKLHSVFAGESAIAEPLCREARRASVARYMLSSKATPFFQQRNATRIHLKASARTAAWRPL